MSPEPLSVKLARLVFWSFTFLLMTTVAATVGGVLALIDPKNALTPQQLQARQAAEKLKAIAPNRDSMGFPRFELARPMTLLVMGVDPSLDAPDDPEAVFSGRSDTLLLVRLDPDRESISLLSVPRDTRVRLGDRGYAKINEANYLGGITLTSEAIADLLDVEIDRYIRIGTGAFRELVDLLGGVEVFVPYPMSYTDRTQQLKIELKPGWQTLNGRQSEHFARFRNDAYGDIGRIQRQHLLVEALQTRLSDPSVLPQVPKIVRVMQKYINTNLSLEELLAAVKMGLGRSPDSLQMVMLPGKVSDGHDSDRSYWIVDRQGRDRVMAQYFGNGDEPERRSQPDERSLKHLDIAVQNASGNPQIPRKLLHELQRQGFKNVYAIEDWPDRQPHSQIIVQKGDLESAKTLQTLLKFPRLETSSTGYLDSDLTLRIGEDVERGDFRF